MLVRPAELLPSDFKVYTFADPGFRYLKLYQLLAEELYFDYVIRCNIPVTATTGEIRTAAARGGPADAPVCCAAPRSPLWWEPWSAFRTLT